MDNKLPKEATQYLSTLFQVCSMCEIDSVAIEKEIVRGKAENDERGIFIMEYDNIPDLGVTLGIRDIKTLKARLSILDENDLKIAYSTKDKDNGDKFIHRMQMSSKKTKVEYTCCDPTRIEAPRRLPDADTFSFKLTEETIKIMNKLKTAIAGVEMISFNSEKDGSVKFIVTADNGDVFDHTVAETHEKLDPNSNKQHFYHSYKIKYVYGLFRAALDLEGETHITLSSRGIIKIRVKGFTIRIVPEE